MRAKSTSRIHIIFFFILTFALILAGRLFFVQVVRGESFKEMADDQYIVPVSNIFSRGNIFFQKRGGELVSAATLKTGYLVAVNPKKITDIDTAYEKINSLIPLDKENFLAKASKKDDPYEEILHRIPRETAVAVQDLGIDGISIHKEHWRFYPGGDMASQVLGIVGYRGNKLAGRYGIERYYDDVLSRDDKKLYINFFAELFSNITDSLLKSDNSKEGDVVLYIEPTVQSSLERNLADLKKKWSSDLVGGIIMDPKDGSIYAMASMPGFDPNNFQKDNPKFFSNPLVERVYEMGSIVKALTMASAIDSGAVNADTVYDDKGFVVLNGSRIENYDGRGRGVVPMQEVLNQSLNTGAVFAMQKMGIDSFSDYMRSYGIGMETGIELPNETHGLIDNLDSTREIEHATASFGQGIAMTPIEAIRALAVLGNGGLLVAPHLVRRIEYETGKSKKTYPDEETRVLKKETSEEITRMLVSVVDDALLGGKVALPNYSIAAKTGTAQIADLQNGGYYKNRFLHSFFGYFPAYDPRFIIFLYNVNPRGARYASQTLTAPFMNLTKFLISYYELPPDR